MVAYARITKIRILHSRRHVRGRAGRPRRAGCPARPARPWRGRRSGGCLLRLECGHGCRAVAAGPVPHGRCTAAGRHVHGHDRAGRPEPARGQASYAGRPEELGEDSARHRVPDGPGRGGQGTGCPPCSPGRMAETCRRSDDTGRFHRDRLPLASGVPGGRQGGLLRPDRSDEVDRRPVLDERRRLLCRLHAQGGRGDPQGRRRPGQPSLRQGPRPCRAADRRVEPGPRRAGRVQVAARGSRGERGRGQRPYVPGVRGISP